MTDWRTSTIRQSRAALFALLIGVPVLAVSAKAAVVAYYAPPAAAPAPPLPPIGYESEDHFPGAAALYVAEEDAAPTTGTTGTIDISTLPIPTNAVLTPDLDGTVKPAQPFSMPAPARSTAGARSIACRPRSITRRRRKATTASARSRRSSSTASATRPFPSPCAA